MREQINSEIAADELEQLQMVEDLERARKLGKRSGTELVKMGAFWKGILEPKGWFFEKHGFCQRYSNV